ncbi:DUF262 domain-containing protein [Neobacillus sp. NPDC097160]|uniref:DUF262 domain-containing protein n=1 Tax=Neobacillus sp. NPDC097160 TaxID=3364298 RepID=UPI0038249D36
MDSIQDSIKKIKFNRPLVSVQDIVEFIKKGEKYLKSDGLIISEEEEFEFLQGIVLSPDYQRTYKSNSTEESSIIESLIVGIPIPEVFLVVSSRNEMQIRHVMDGQHRLNSIFRYVNNEFPLKNLEILKDDDRYLNKRFNDLEKKDKIKILSSHLSILEFESFENPQVEIELFKRYNRNTKPLENQEIEMATYFSDSSKYISNFINRLISHTNETKMSKRIEDEKDILHKIYNITKSRSDKQKNHQEICVIMYILENGLKEGLRDGSMISKIFLEEKALLYKRGEGENLDMLVDKFDEFNKMLLILSREVEYPFSSEMIDNKEEKKVIKFLMGVAIVLAAIQYYYDMDIKNPNMISEVMSIVQISPIANPEYKASTTNLKNVMTYLFSNHQIHLREFESLRLKDGSLNSIGEFLGGIQYNLI